LCWIPFLVAVVLSAFFKALITPVVVLVISTLVFSNSGINPVLYGFSVESRLPVGLQEAVAQAFSDVCQEHNADKEKKRL